MDFAHLKAFMDAAVPRLGMSGIDCMIYKEHKEIFRYTAGFGDMENKTPLATDAIYNVYSATKIVTCVAALKLVERGMMLLTDPLHRYLPEFKDMLVKTGTLFILPAKKQIRVVDLFAMTAGFTYEGNSPALEKLKQDTDGDFNLREFAQALAKEPLAFEPGEAWNYSFCHDVLGALVEVVSGMSFGDYLKQHIFDPLEMKDTGFDLPEEKAGRLAPQYSYNPLTGTIVRISGNNLARLGKRFESAGAGMITTVDDYMRFASALANGGVGANGVRVISERALGLLTQNRLKGRLLEDFWKIGLPEGYGYGLGVAVLLDPEACMSMVPKGVFSWAGMGGVQVRIDPANKIAFFVAQHALNSPVVLIGPQMMNALYSGI